jgi:hypothetical protein
VARKVEEARRDPRINAGIKTALKRFAARQPYSAGTLQIDNGKAPADNTTFVVSTSLSLVSLDDCNNRDDRDDRDHREDLDDVITIDSRAETAGALTVLAVEDTRQTELLNRWIVDPGSNTHVINTEAWQGWKRTTNNPECRSINAGNSCILITAWGTMEIVARTPYGLQTLELTHVAYVGGFLTSVLGLARCRTELIHFDSGRDVLYMRQASNVIAQLEYNGGHWLINAEPSYRPTLSLYHTQLSTFGASYRPSYAPKPANVVDRGAAHQI